MALSIGRLTGITPAGNRIYQKVENGIRTISSVKDGKIVREIKLNKLHNDLEGYSVIVNDFKSNLSHRFSDITDHSFEENFKTVSKETRNKLNGTVERSSITRSKDGDSVEITRAKTKPNGEEFWLIHNTRKNPDGTTVFENHFETSGYGWEKPDGEYLNGFYQSAVTSKSGKVIQSEKYGDIDVLPTLNELG